MKNVKPIADSDLQKMVCDRQALKAQRQELMGDFSPESLANPMALMTKMANIQETVSVSQKIEEISDVLVGELIRIKSEV